jgi:pimeloyl-ACP methyl ester carboxylesterase
MGRTEVTSLWRVEGGRATVTASATKRGRAVEWRGLELFVREQGAGDPVLLINGLGASADMWGVLEQELARTGRTIVFDLPGSGLSPTPALPLSIAALARVTTGLLDELGYERVDVLGFSYGGLVAQQLARDAPSRIRRLALAATACGWGSMPGSLEALALVSMPLRYHSRALYEQTSRLLSPSDSELLGRVPALKEARLAQPPSLLGYAYQLMAGALWSSFPWLASVRVPTLVLAGDGDELVPPANGVQLARLLPESRLYLLPGEGHLFVFDPETAAVPLVADFLSSPTLDECRAWSGGMIVEDDASVNAAFRNWGGAQPHRAISDAYRWFVERSARNGASF